MDERDPIQRMRERMQTLFKDFEENVGGLAVDRRIRGVPVDIEETTEELIVRADMPGVEKEHIRVEVGKDHLELEAQDDTEVTHEEKEFYRRERSSRRMYRRVGLPVEVDPESADAQYTDGVLTITMTKTGKDGMHSVDIA